MSVDSMVSVYSQCVWSVCMFGLSVTRQSTGEVAPLNL